MSSNDKYKIDTLMLFGFLIGFFLIAFDVILTLKPPKFQFIESTICNHFNWICKNKINLKVFYLVFLSVCSMGIHC